MTKIYLIDYNMFSKLYRELIKPHRECAATINISYIKIEILEKNLKQNLIKIYTKAHHIVQFKKKYLTVQYTSHNILSI